MNQRIPCDRIRVQKYVEYELSKTLPDGWEFSKPETENLWWIISPKEVRDGEWNNQDYSLQISEDLNWFIITHGNCDVGVYNLNHDLQNAVVIKRSGVERWTLGACIQHVLKNCKTNEWGYT
jgi:hypothetical protein